MMKSNKLKLIKINKKSWLLLVNIILILFVLTLLTGCLSANQSSKQEGQASYKDFTLKDLSGNEVSLSDFAGKVIVLNFWATWCPPCRTEIPDFVEIYNKYKDMGVVFLGVSLDEDREALEKFIYDYKINYPIVLDNQDDNVAVNWGVNAIPTTFFLDSNGNVVGSQVGQMSKSRLETVIKSLVE